MTTTGASSNKRIHSLPGSRRGFIRTTAGLLGSSALGGLIVGCDDDGVAPSPADVSEQIDRAAEAFLRNTGAPGVALALITPTEPGSGDANIDLRTFGTAVRGSDEPITLTTLFDLGSITKTFTALMFTWMWQRLGLVGLEGVVQERLPRDIVTLPIWRKTPQGGTREILFRDLATYTPGLPDIFLLTYQELFDLIKRDREKLLEFEPGSCYLYSDLGWDLLAYTLAYIHSDGNGFDYSPVLRELLAAADLSMSDTVIQLTPDQRERLACGYRGSDRNCQPVRPGDLLIKSTIQDMSVWLAFHMGFMPQSPFADLLPALFEVRYDGGQFEPGKCRKEPAIQTTIGWFFQDIPGVGARFHKDGAIEGFTSYMVFFQEAKTGVVVLANHTHTQIAQFGNDLLCLITAGCEAE